MTSRSLPQSFKRGTDVQLLDAILFLYQRGLLAAQFTLYREDFDEGVTHRENALHEILYQSHDAETLVR